MNDFKSKILDFLNRRNQPGDQDESNSKSIPKPPGHPRVMVPSSAAEHAFGSQEYREALVQDIILRLRSNDNLTIAYGSTAFLREGLQMTDDNLQATGAGQEHVPPLLLLTGTREDQHGLSSQTEIDLDKDD